MSPRAPIALFAFNRPAHTAKALAALSACDGAADSELTVFIDGARDANDAGAVAAVAALFSQPLPFRRVDVRMAVANKGLYAAITEGVSAMLRLHEQVIVVEDDLVVTPEFLDYMRDGLARYRDEPRVGCIHGYALPLTGLPGFYFLRGGDCWGWATWRDRWALLRPDPVALIRELVQRNALDAYMQTQGTASLRMLCDRARGRNQSWAILWHASLWLADRLTLHPGASFVENIGNDGSGTHSGSANARFDATIHGGYHGIPALPIAHDPDAARAVSAFHDHATPLARLLAPWRRLHARRLAHALARSNP